MDTVPLHVAVVAMCSRSSNEQHTKPICSSCSRLCVKEEKLETERRRRSKMNCLSCVGAALTCYIPRILHCISEAIIATVATCSKCSNKPIHVNNCKVTINP